MRERDENTYTGQGTFRTEGPPVRSGAYLAGPGNSYFRYNRNSLRFVVAIAHTPLYMPPSAACWAVLAACALTHAMHAAAAALSSMPVRLNIARYPGPAPGANTSVSSIPARTRPELFQRVLQSDVLRCDMLSVPFVLYVVLMRVCMQKFDRRLVRLAKFRPFLESVCVSGSVR